MHTFPQTYSRPVYSIHIQFSHTPHSDLNECFIEFSLDLVGSGVKSVQSVLVLLYLLLHTYTQGEDIDY